MLKLGQAQVNWGGWSPELARKARKKAGSLEGASGGFIPKAQATAMKAPGRRFAETPGLDNEHGQVQGVSSETRARLLPAGPLAGGWLGEAREAAGPHLAGGVNGMREEMAWLFENCGDTAKETVCGHISCQACFFQSMRHAQKSPTHREK